MNNKNFLLILGIFSIMFFLSVGYAVVSNSYSKLEDDFSAANTDLDVEIVDVMVTTNSNVRDVEFNYYLFDNNLSSKFTINKMKLGDKVNVFYIVASSEENVDVKLSLDGGVILSNSNSDYFKTTYEIIDSITNLRNNDNIMGVMITLELIKTPIFIEDSSITLGLILTVIPVGLR